MENGKLNHEKQLHTFKWEDKPLPKIPPPNLEHTLQRLVEYAKALTDGKEDEFKRFENAVNAFKKQAIPLEEKLQKIAATETNWATRFMKDFMYFKMRVPLPFFSNAVQVFPVQKFETEDDQLEFAAWLARGFCEVKDRIDRRAIVPDLPTGHDKSRLCMKQYEYFFNCYRESCFPDDTLTVKNTSQDTRIVRNEHIIVMCNNQAFVVTTRAGGVLLNQKEILHQMREAVRISRNKAKETVIAVGGSTGGHRDDAARFWEEMRKVEKNEESLSLVRSAIFFVCIDVADSTSANSSNRGWNSEQNCHRVLHGCGTKNGSLNRWFNATCQLIIARDGTNGICLEHSATDGIVAYNIHRTVHSYINERRESEKEIPMTVVISPKPLTWYVSAECKELLDKMAAEMDAGSSDLQLHIVKFDEFGRKLIKSLHHSPDGFVQLTMQLAYYRTHKRICTTYESASLRRFEDGRVDNIRAATPEVLAWVKAMDDPHTPVARKKALFNSAAAKQALITKEAISGFGIDNHLAALYYIAEDAHQSYPIFEDPLWKELQCFILGTSQVTTDENETDLFFAYGPMVKNGYGCCYNIQNNRITFLTSANRSQPELNIDEFKKALTTALKDIRVLITCD